MRPRVPSYFDSLLQGFYQGEQGRFVHLGHWDHPPSLDVPGTPGEFHQAQIRMNEYLLEMAQLQDGHDVLDIGCGFGGTLQRIDQTFRQMSLTGVNIDPRQLKVCFSLESAADNRFLWHEADACALPFADCTFDRAFCIEAMFHFSSRAGFFSEVARVLRPSGILVVSDIVVLRDQVESQITPAEVASVLDEGYGPWPHPWSQLDELKTMPATFGLICESAQDVTLQTLPIHRFTVTGNFDRDCTTDIDPDTHSGLMRKWLHERKLLQYVYAKYERTV